MFVLLKKTFYCDALLVSYVPEEGCIDNDDELSVECFVESCRKGDFFIIYASSNNKALDNTLCQNGKRSIIKWHHMVHKKLY